jgi:hypothetical protein
LSDSTTNPRSPEVDELTSYERELMDKLFSNPRLWPDTAKVWIADYVSQNSLLPISQVQGFTQFTAKQASHNFGGSPSSTTSATFANVSPSVELTDISPGQYLLFYGGNGLPGVQDLGYIGLSINSAVPVSGEYVQFWGGNGPAGGTNSHMLVAYKTLTESINTLTIQIAVQTGGDTFQVNYAFVTALRIGNP